MKREVARKRQQPEEREELRHRVKSKRRERQMVESNSKRKKKHEKGGKRHLGAILVSSEIIPQPEQKQHFLDFVQLYAD